MNYQLKALIEINRALQELVDLKELKEKRGETEEYLRRKPLAWATARRVARKYKLQSHYWGVHA